MVKDILTIENVKKDIFCLLKWQMSNASDRRFAYIIPVSLLALLMGIFFKNIWLACLIFSVAVYHIVRYIMAYRIYKMKKMFLMNAVNREDFSVSLETLSQIADETIYEPYNGMGRTHAAKDVKRFYFLSGASWRVPSIDKHYAWSKDFYVRTEGLDHISICGDNFYYIALQNDYDMAYIYPCKLFEPGIFLPKQ